ncbi:hypothetical protein EOD39_0979 [Acipenser ruthenus]|uniref:LINE-1 type transposase domain-containing protein 1 n=1 Tax=Acipenser ruthenus TaxID=7906 RepID=A0A444UIV3_ACIRT|nr:hypothetical protein EOD39_0979 [Acipenser ruthenus]
MAADPTTLAAGSNADAGESAAGPGYSSVMLEDFRRIVKEVLRDEIATLRTEILQAIAVIQATLSECTEKIQDVEDSMNAFEIRLAGTESTCSLLSCENIKLGAKIDDLENRSRRNNLRVFRVPEGIEEGRPTEFMSSFFIELFGQNGLDSPPALERTHHSPAPKPRPPKSFHFESAPFSG